MKNNLINFSNLDNNFLDIYRKIYNINYKDFHLTIEELLNKNKNIDLIITHTIFSRNNYLSSFYKDFCLFKSFKELYKNNEKYKLIFSSYKQYLIFRNKLHCCMNFFLKEVVESTTCSPVV